MVGQSVVVGLDGAVVVGLVPGLPVGSETVEPDVVSVELKPGSPVGIWVSVVEAELVGPVVELVGPVVELVGPVVELVGPVVEPVPAVELVLVGPVVVGPDVALDPELHPGKEVGSLGYDAPGSERGRCGRSSSPHGELPTWDSLGRAGTSFAPDVLGTHAGARYASEDAPP